MKIGLQRDTPPLHMKIRIPLSLVEVRKAVLQKRA
jgi:hypothetical protein